MVSAGDSVPLLDSHGQYSPCILFFAVKGVNRPDHAGPCLQRTLSPLSCARLLMLSTESPIRLLWFLRALSFRFCPSAHVFQATGASQNGLRVACRYLFEGTQSVNTRT